LLGVGLLVGALWAMFAIDLGGRTFAEHMDTISDTPEAQELVDGARSTVNPALQELRDRVLGEYVEAPTWIPDPYAGAPAPEIPAPAPANTDDSTLASGLEPPLPGHRDDASPVAEPPESPVAEPPLPGRRPPSALDEDPSLQPPLPGR